MRRLVLIFFVVLLPLQFAWGAAARYCGHESAPTAQHFGHHAHVHHGTTDSTKATPALADDADCDYCHLGCAQPLSSSAAVLSAEPTSIRIDLEPSPSRQREASVIDRPNWFLLA
ncbi:hypothetical protein GHT07_09580 [Caenimonas koreensis DSM 17982]|uniref:Cobalt-zinc-cadmium efflux system protein n=1 Tax=Caenimonas koreensis DSM 17982 TaxID=1121255 RepID=A0A844AYP4_9BURK|nr:cation efflux protein, CzcI family [Caenimonas koreensis]MRD47528.1 hypothetical protein [Caenimonas koreensis DSM 17982]